MKKVLITLFFLLFLLTASLFAQSTEPITGAAFDSLLANQHIEIQKELEKIFPESEGYIVSGPISYYRDYDFRILCPDINAYEHANNVARNSENTNWFKNMAFMQQFSCFLEDIVGPFKCYSSFSFNNNSDEFLGVITSIQKDRFQLFSSIHGFINTLSKDSSEYCEELLAYLSKVEIGDTEVKPPLTTDYNLPDDFDFYAPPPDYVIDGYQNYKDFLNPHAEINTELISGVTEFTASGDALQWFKDHAPREAYPNKEWRMLQHEYKKFFERGGDMRSMQTLTSEGFDTLTTGEYFFAVSPSGKIRFGKEMLREEVEKIETEIGQKVPRANHAFLFPGEYILTAGAFFIDDSKDSKLVKVNAQSGHFFYSNLNESIRDDIAVKSDHYLLTLGHFFTALDNLGIPYDRIIISKF